MNNRHSGKSLVEPAGTSARRSTQKIFFDERTPEPAENKSLALPGSARNPAISPFDAYAAKRVRNKAVKTRRLAPANTRKSLQNRLQTLPGFVWNRRFNRYILVAVGRKEVHGPC